MLLAAAIIIWLGNRRGMRYWHWLGAYLVICAADLVLLLLGGNLALEGVMTVVGLGYALTFWLWPHLVTPEHKQAMQAQAEANQREEHERAERFYASLDDWLAVKIYVDTSQVYELQADRKRLEDAAVPSFVKTAGITTLFVAKADFEKACGLLGIQPLDAGDAGDAGDAAELSGPA